MTVKATKPYRQRHNGRLVDLQPGDAVPEFLHGDALDRGWGAERTVKSRTAKTKPGDTAE